MFLSCSRSIGRISPFPQREEGIKQIGAFRSFFPIKSQHFNHKSIHVRPFLRQERAYKKEQSYHKKKKYDVDWDRILESIPEKDGIIEEYVDKNQDPFANEKEREQQQEPNNERKRVKVKFRGEIFFHEVNTSMKLRELLQELLILKGEITAPSQIPPNPTNSSKRKSRIMKEMEREQISADDITKMRRFYFVYEKYEKKFRPSKAKMVYQLGTELRNTRFLCEDEGNTEVSCLVLKDEREWEGEPLEESKEAETEQLLQKRLRQFNRGKRDKYNTTEYRIIHELQSMYGDEFTKINENLRELIGVMEEGIIEEKIWKTCFSDRYNSQIIDILLLRNASTHHHHLKVKDEKTMSASMLFMRKTDDYKSLIKYLYAALIEFSSFATKTINSISKLLLQTSDEDESFEIILPEFLRYFQTEYVNNLKSFSSEYDNDIDIPKAEYEAETLDLSSPHLWYPIARNIKRKVVIHIGPTNSGKTYNALLDLKAAKTGIYCGPLRILAAEIYEKFLEEGTAISLVTGQQKKIHPHSTHISCTIEMADISKVIDCAVIDEIQMITDPMRGWAWTRAVLALPAKTIHLCGNESILGIIQNICQKIGEEVEVKQYTRLSPLTADLHPIGDIADLEKGDCIIAFSRKHIYEYKRKIENSTRLKCSLVYGRLPPESRWKQATLFNNQQSGFDLLVASDAIGMGLNLNIRRVIFSTTEKFDGECLRPLSISEIKQIAGRAGRFSGRYQHGFTGGFTYKDCLRIARALNTDLPQLTFAGLRPEFEQIQHFVNLMPKQMLFSQIIERMHFHVQMDNDYFLCNTRDMVGLAQLIDNLPLSLMDRYTFCIAPFDTREKISVRFFKRYAYHYSRLMLGELKGTIHLGFETQQFFKFRLFAEKFIAADVPVLNSISHVIDGYLWLANHFPLYFSEKNVELALKEQEVCHRCTEQALLDITIDNRFHDNHYKKKQHHYN